MSWNKAYVGGLLLLLAAQVAVAQDANPKIGHPWARATVGNAQTGAVYMTIESTVPDRLTATSTPIASRAEIHGSEVENSVMKMHKVDAITIRPDTPAMLKPGGLHVMLFGLKQPLKEGQTFPLTLTFANAGVREVSVTVESARAPGSMGDPHNAMSR